MPKIPVIQSLVYKNSKAIVLPVWVEGEAGYGNLAHPDPYVLDTYQKWPIATKFIDGDKVFHYGYLGTIAAGSLTRSGLGMQNIDDMDKPTADAVIHAVAETEIVIEDTASGLNKWAGGMFMNYVAPYFTGHRVLSNTAHDGEHVTLTLERGLITAMASSQASNELYANPFRTLGSSRLAADLSAPVVGVLIIAPVASRYCWVQTWGTCIVCGGDENPGSDSGLHMGQFNFDGTLIWVGWTGTTTNTGPIYAGHLVNDTGSATTAQHQVFLMLAY